MVATSGSLYSFFFEHLHVQKLKQFYKDNICGNTWVNRYHSNSKNSQKFCQISQERNSYFCLLLVYHRPLLVEKCRRRAYGGTIKCIVTHPLDSPLASHPRYLGLYEIWNIWLLLSLLCTTKWILYGNIHDYKFLWKGNRWSFNCVIHMEKNYKWLSKKAWNMLTINPMQAGKIIYMTIFFLNYFYIYIWFYIKILINCQENKGFQM